MEGEGCYGCEWRRFVWWGDRVNRVVGGMVFVKVRVIFYEFVGSII